MQNEPYMVQIAKAASVEEMAKLTAIALDDFSRKVSSACMVSTCDIVFMAVVLRQYADSYEKRVPAEQKEFMRGLMTASKEAAQETEVVIPGWLAK